MSDKPIPAAFGFAGFEAAHPCPRRAAPRRRLRAALIAIAATAITLSAVADGYAQRIVTVGRVNIPTTVVRAPVVEVPRFSGSDVPRNPAAGVSPRLPGGPGGVIV